LNDTTINETSDFVRIGYNLSLSEFNNGGLRWIDVAVPNGAAIISATLSVYPVLESGTLESVVKGIDEDDTPTWSSGNRPSQRAKTTAEVQADVADWDNWDTFQWATLDITSIISEIINRPGWVSGNALAIVLENTSETTNWVMFFSYDYTNPAYAAKLDITYDTSDPTDYNIVSSEETQHTISTDSESQHNIVSSSEVQHTVAVSSEMQHDIEIIRDEE